MNQIEKNMKAKLKEAVRKMKLAMQFRREACLIDKRVYITPSINRISVVNGDNIENFDNPKLSKAVDILKAVIIADNRDVDK